MSTMISEVYDALLAAGAPEEKARKAAETLASYENRFSTLENKLTILDGKVNLLTWMASFNLALTVAILWRVFV